MPRKKAINAAPRVTTRAAQKNQHKANVQAYQRKKNSQRKKNDISGKFFCFFFN